MLNIRLFCLLFIFSPLVFAEQYHWQSVPIGGGGYVTGLQFHPKQKDLLYARTDVGGAYRWQEKHKRWLSISDGVGHFTADDMGVVSLSLDPQAPERVYMLAGLYYQDWAPMGAFLSSQDRGKTWTRTPLAFRVGGNEDARGAGERIAVDPNFPSRIFIGSSRQGLWLSEDYGQHWQKVEHFSPENVLFVEFAPNKGQSGNASPIIYVAVNEPTHSLYRSVDAGKSWQAVANQPEGVLFKRASWSGNMLYLAAADALGPNGANKGSIWRYDTDKNLWSDLKPPKGSGGYSGISVSKQNPQRLIASTMNRWHPGNQVFLSEDGGQHWRSLLDKARWSNNRMPHSESHTPHWLADIKLDPFNDNRALFVTGYGIYESRNISGKKVRWDFQSEGLEETVILELISPPKGTHLLSVMGDIDGFRHDKLSRSPKRFEPERGSNNSISFAAQEPKVMARTIESGEEIHLALSHDGGKQWHMCASEPENAKAGQVAWNSDATTLAWTPEKKPLFVSHDNCKSWQASQGLPNNLKPIADAINPSIFYAYDPEKGQIYFSKNKGKSFSKGQGQLPSLAFWQRHEGNLRAVPKQEGEVFITTGNALFYSSDYGKNATEIKGIENSYLITFGKAKKKNGYPAIYLYGKINNQVGYYRSDDKAQTWTRINDDQHQFARPRSMTGDPRVYGRLYIGTNGRGIIMGNIR